MKRMPKNKWLIVIHEQAVARATELLMAHLDEQQCLSYQQHRKFHVVGADGKRYEIDCQLNHRNVFEVDDQGKRLRGFCIYQLGDCPLPDNHLAQKLALEADIETFKRVANPFAIAG